MPSDRPPENEPFSPIPYTSDVFPTERAVPGHGPGRRHGTGNGNRSRRARINKPRPWFHPRPQPRRRADLMGFNAFMWLIALVLVVVLLFWF